MQDEEYKRCTKCGEEKPVEEFQRERRRLSGRTAQCKTCRSQYDKANRERLSAQQRRWEHENPDRRDARRARYVERHKAKVKARSDLNHAVERGEIIRPGVCDSCGGSAEVQGHHRDYARPLEVEWLCQGCHFDRHNEE